MVSWITCPRFHAKIFSCDVSGSRTPPEVRSIWLEYFLVPWSFSTIWVTHGRLVREMVGHRGMPKLCYNSDDCKKFSIFGAVVHLWPGKGLTSVGNHLLLTILDLRENSANPKCACVSVKDKRITGRIGQDWHSCQVWVELIGVLRHMQRYFSHKCDGTDVQAAWRRSCTYGRAPNAIDISQGSLTCPSYTDTGPPFLYPQRVVKGD